MLKVEDCSKLQNIKTKKLILSPKNKKYLNYNFVIIVLYIR